MLRIILLLLLLTRVNTREWEYLYSEPFKARYAIAAYYLRDCETIIEIGGYKTPISDFVEGKKVIVIDPRVDLKLTDLVTQLPITFQEWTDSSSIKGEFGLLILGFELNNMSPSDWKRFYDLVDDSKRVLIGIPKNYQPSIVQLNQILANVKKKQVMKIHLDFTENTYDLSSNSWPLIPIRVIYVLE